MLFPSASLFAGSSDSLLSDEEEDDDDDDELLLEVDDSLTFVDDSTVDDSVLATVLLLVDEATVAVSFERFKTQIPAPTGIATIKKSKTKTIVKKSEFPRFCFRCCDREAESSYSVS